MKVLDFHRSFFFFEIDFGIKPPKTVSDPRQNQHNRARIRIDCRCRITRPNGKASEFYLGEACKTERVGCSRELGLFVEPNADFRPVYSAEDFIVFKSWQKNDMGLMLNPPSLGPQPARQVISCAEAFYKHRLLVKQVEAKPLRKAKEVVAATDAGKALVARTEYVQAGHKILLEYPVVTLNVSEKHVFFQTDTGPMLFPEITKGTKRLGETFRLAFSAFKEPDWIEFIVQKPTPVGHGITVNHYSERVQVDCRNTMFAV